MAGHGGWRDMGDGGMGRVEDSRNKSDGDGGVVA
jgi:hypothetical protein